MADQSRTTPDPGRQATFGIILLMLVWTTYCMLQSPVNRQPDNQADNAAADNAALTANADAGDGSDGADDNASANAAGDPANTAPDNAPATNTNAPAANADNGSAAGNADNQPDNGGQPGVPDGQIRPRADGKWMRDPGTGEYFPPNYAFNPATGQRLEATDEPPAGHTGPGPGPQTGPDSGSGTGTDTGEPQTRATLSRPRQFSPGRDTVPLIGDESFDTDKIKPRFSTRGGGLADLVVIGFPGMDGRDHRTDLTENSHIVRPFVPDALAFTTEAKLPGLVRAEDLARAEWEFLGHRVVPATEDESGDGDESAPVSEEGQGTDADGESTSGMIHIAEFRYPPGGGQQSVDGGDPVGWEVIRRFRWRNDSFEIDVELEFRNFTDQPIELPAWQAHGPMGTFTGYRPAQDDYVHFAVDPTAGVKLVKETPDGNTSESIITGDKPLQDIGASQYFPRGGYEHDPMWNAMYRVRAASDRSDRDIRWIGQSVDYMMAAMFTPEGENAPRATHGHIVPIDVQVTNPAAAGDPEEPGPHRWVFGCTYTMAPLTIPAGGSTAMTFRSYIGPKYPDHMERVGLSSAVYYSYSAVEWIAKPLLGAMRFFHDVIPNWGIAIILLTLLVRGILLPVSYWSQLKMQTTMADMKRIQPRMEKLRAKYKDDKAKLQQEMIKLYREEKVSFGGMFQGCLLMLLQMPIWIALFGAFRYSIDFVGADFLWINDLSKSDALFTIAHFRIPELPLIGPMFSNAMTPAGVFHLNVLPIFVMILMYTQTRMQQKMQSAAQTPEQQQQQKIMMGCMFVFFFILFYAMPAGFNLYFLATSAYALLETRYIKRIVQAKIDAHTESRGGGKKAKA